jgi:alpha-1,2-mannosyltransferase
VSPTMRIFLWIAALASAFVAGQRLVESHEDGEFYCRDFIQEYVLARCLLDGEAPYRPLPEVVDTYFPDQPKLPWTHPTPHPPPAALATLPLGVLSYRAASIVWLVLELACLAFAIVLLARAWGEPVSVEIMTMVFFLSLIFGPVIRELWLGQFGAMLLVLVTLSWINLRIGRDAIGGMWLGLALAIKLVGWPIALFLAFRGRWRAVVAAALVVILLHGAALLVMGWEPILAYYTDIGPRVARENRFHLENFSLWPLGSRLFSDERMIWASQVVLEPLWPNPPLERPVTIGVPLVALAAALLLARRQRSFDSAFGILLCAGLVMNPVVWDHYLVLTALPIVVIARRLIPGGTTLQKGLALVGTAISIIPRPGDLHLAIRTFGWSGADGIHLGFLPGLLTYLPLVPLAIWIGLLWATDSSSPENDTLDRAPLASGTPEERGRE